MKLTEGLGLFKGVRLLFLPIVLGATFIQGAMFIPDLRVCLWRDSMSLDILTWWRIDPSKCQVTTLPRQRREQIFPTVNHCKT